MRVNKYIALATGLSRRAADEAIMAKRVLVNGTLVHPGYDVTDSDDVSLDGKALSVNTRTTTIVLNKPVGYVVSRDGQGSSTVYDLLPQELHTLKPVGRLDKDSSGLLLLTNDGEQANQLTHPRYQKEKMYQITLDKPLTAKDWERIQAGVHLEDGISKLALTGKDNAWTITMSEGRNRQIRRTFAALNYTVIGLHRTQFGSYQLGSLAEGQYKHA